MKTFILAAALLAALVGDVSVARAQSADEQLAAASALFDAHKYQSAAQTLAAFLAAHPTHPKAGAAALALGRCRSELGQYAQAVPAYRQAVASKDPAVTTFAELGLGEAALRTSQWQVAAGALGAATQATLTPEQGAIAWDWLGQADSQLGRFGPAEHAYQTVIDQYPQSDYAADAYYGAGLAELRLGRADDARRKLKTLADRYPNSDSRPQALAQLGQLDLDAKRWQDARTDFEGALAGKGLDADTRLAAKAGLVDALLGAGDDAGAASRLQTLLDQMPASDPQRPQTQLTLGNALYRQKQYEPALTAYQAAAASPDAAVASQGVYWAANVQLALKRPAEAAALFAQVAQKYPASALASKAQLRAGDALMAAGQSAAASRAYQTVLTKFPQSPEAGAARTALGGALDATDDPAQLAAALATASGAEKVTGTLRLARLYLDAKKYAAASTALTGLTAGAEPLSGPQSAEAHYLLGLALDAQNKAAPAAAALAQAVAGDPQASWTADAQTQLAWLYVGLKQPAKGEAAATAALAHPTGDNFTPAQEQQARLALVQADLDQQKWDGALEQCQVLLAANPPPDVQATVLYTQAWVSDKQNKPDAALPLWQKLADQFPQSADAPEARLRLADARFAAGQFADARDQYTALLTQYPQSAVAPDARFKLGSSLYSLNQYEAAAAEFDQVAADKAAGDDKPEGLYWAGASFQKAGKSAEAIARLSRLVQEYPASPRVATAKVRLAALKAVSGPEREASMYELFIHAGIVGYVLVACSIVALAIMLERLWTLSRLRQLEDAAYAALQASPTPAILDTPAFADAPMAQILRSLAPLRGSSEETIGQAADIALSLQRLRLRRFLGTLATIGSTAPFIGLFGTVLGVMLAFSSMSHAGLSSEVMAGGISQALSATALGLLVAVPSIVAYNYFVGRIGILLLHVQAHVALLAPRLMAAAPVPERDRVA